MEKYKPPFTITNQILSYVSSISEKIGRITATSSLEAKPHLRRNNKTRMEVSIDEPLNVDWDGNELLLSDILGTEEDVIYQGLEQEAEHRVLGSAISKLSEREQVIVKLRFGINMPEGREKTQKEVADLLGISQSYISRLEKRIMKRLRKEIARYE